MDQLEDINKAPWMILPHDLLDHLKTAMEQATASSFDTKTLNLEVIMFKTLVKSRNPARRIAELLAAFGVETQKIPSEVLSPVIVQHLISKGCMPAAVPVQEKLG
jgi:hypothetical protein